MFEELRHAVVVAVTKRYAADYWLDRCTEWHMLIESKVAEAGGRVELAKGNCSTPLMAKKDN